MYKTRQLSALLALSLTFACLTACGSDDDDGDNGGGTGGSATGGSATGGSATGGEGTGGAATGGSATGGEATGGSSTGGTSTEGTFPADTSQASVAAFVASEVYRQAPWIGDAAPRPAVGITSPHGDVRVFFNPAVVPAIGVEEPTIPPNSMIVKEMYDGSGTLVGKAVNLRQNSADPWTFYCFAPESRCQTGEGDVTEADPIYGRGLEVGCGFCHAETISATQP